MASYLPAPPAFFFIHERQRTETYVSRPKPKADAQLLSLPSVPKNKLSSNFFTVSFLLSSSLFPYCSLWKAVTIHSSYLRSWDLCFTSMKAEYLHKLFGILQHGRVVYIVSCLFIFQLFINIGIDAWILYFGL